MSCYQIPWRICKPERWKPTHWIPIQDNAHGGSQYGRNWENKDTMSTVLWLGYRQTKLQWFIFTQEKFKSSSLFSCSLGGRCSTLRKRSDGKACNATCWYQVPRWNLVKEHWDPGRSPHIGKRTCVSPSHKASPQHPFHNCWKPGFIVTLLWGRNQFGWPLTKYRHLFIIKV